MKNATVSQCCGKWYVSIQTAREVEQPMPNGGVVGIEGKTKPNLSSVWISAKKPLSEGWHVCDYGTSCSRDENAAKVMLNWALTGSAAGQELA